MRARTPLHVLVLAGGACALLVALTLRPASAEENRLLGAWKVQGTDHDAVLFEEHRVREFRAGQLSFSFAHYDRGTVILWSWTKKVTWKTVLQDKTLRIDDGAGTRVLVRLPTPPPEVAIEPLALGKPAALPDARIEAIQTDLAGRLEAYQAVRRDPPAGADAAKQREKAKAVGKVDSENAAWLVALVKEVGWIDVTRFGVAASKGAFLLVQHSADRALMLAALPEIEKDVAAKRLDAQYYALLYDRLHLDLGEKQRFGTQVSLDMAGKWVILPLEDREHVETIRERMGLSPLATYLDLVKAQFGGAMPKFMEWE